MVKKAPYSITITIKNCINKANISGGVHIGGIGGGAGITSNTAGNIHHCVVIDSCFNSGNIRGIFVQEVYWGQRIALQKY